jgi:hypothetical protein
MGKYVSLLRRKLNPSRGQRPAPVEVAHSNGSPDTGPPLRGRPEPVEGDRPADTIAPPPACGGGAVSAISAESGDLSTASEPDRSVRCADCIRAMLDGGGRPGDEITAAVRQRGFSLNDETKARAILLERGYRASAGWFGLGEPSKWRGYGSDFRTGSLDPVLTATSGTPASCGGKPSSPLGRFSDAEKAMLKVINRSKKPLTVTAANSRFVVASPSHEFRPPTPAEAAIVLERLAEWQLIVREEGDPIRYRRQDL